ncbi:MAG: precorrin-3B C17-methyltransferase / cobalt-factor methyltransferase [Methylobacteriaceae bacterium]|nr:precorrin-3B C17-methyltransferase / cobalt-factor methyltransferase [Methylobacteriaceae bacterium]
MSGRLFVVGLGPGDPDWLTPEAARVLSQATDLVGYGLYLDRVPVRAGQTRHGSDNRAEIERARHGLALSSAGGIVAIVSGGDPGIFAMAAAVFEAIENGEASWGNLEIEIVPGITAIQAAAARAGAPLGHDFCAISLSDNLKPWSLIEKRLQAAAEGDFVIALYNPASKARPDGIRDAFALLMKHKSGATPVIIARAVGRSDEKIEITTLAETDVSRIDMATLVLIGSSATRLIPRATGRPWVYTPRAAS